MPEKKKEPLVPKDKKELHIKPTKKELDEKAQKALEEAEKLKNQPEPTEKEPKETPKPKEKPPEPKKPDYKKKYIESQRESLILHEKNKKTNEALQQAMETPEPTEKELKEEYSDWDEMTDSQKRMAKDNLSNTRRFQVLDEIAQTNKNLAEWDKKVSKLINDPQTLIDNPKLEGKEDEFKLFAIRPTRQGTDFDVLISAFLYNATEKGNKPGKKGSMFEQGTGGPTDKGTPKTNKLTTTQARDLRKNDFKKYKEYLNKGLIEEPKFD